MGHPAQPHAWRGGRIAPTEGLPSPVGPPPTTLGGGTRSHSPGDGSSLRHCGWEKGWDGSPAASVTSAVTLPPQSLCASVSPCSQSPKGGRRARSPRREAPWDSQHVPSQMGQSLCPQAGWTPCPSRTGSPSRLSPGSLPAAPCRPRGWHRSRPSAGPRVPVERGVPGHVAQPGQNRDRHPGADTGAQSVVPGDVTCACVRVHACACV